jgi:hypothetical protein
MTAPDTRAPMARFAAAQAVVAQRLGLPLLHANVFRDTAQYPLDGTLKLTGGGVQIDEEQYLGWLRALPDPIALERFTAVATMGAAGCVSEGVGGIYPGDGPGQNFVLTQLLGMAGALGLGGEAAKNWMAQRVQQAHEILLQDEGAAWDRIRENLEARSRLEADEVRALIEESDA